MKILVSYDKSNSHLGYDVFLDDERIALIDGNNPNVSNSIPRVLFNLTPYSVWGYTHPDVISPILRGEHKPFLMISNKAQAHTLFEHGMKAAWGQIRVMKDVPVMTRLDTFYTLIASERDKLELNSQITSMAFHSESQVGDNALEISFSGNRRVWIANSRKFRNQAGNNVLYLDSVENYVSVDVE